MGLTPISWADYSFNPWWGCRQVSPACRNCYAKAFDKRTGHNSWGAHGERRLFGDNHWAEPLKWNQLAEQAGRPQRVFCASMADVFEEHPALADERARLWELIDQTPALIWMLLTKRPENAAAMVPARWRCDGWPARVWCGVSAETQRFADQRIPILLGLPLTGVPFVSAAPLLGLLNLDAYLKPWPGYCQTCGARLEPPHATTCVACRVSDDDDGHAEPRRFARITWVISEGESGPKARPSHPDWFRSLRDQCVATGVAYHHKQSGEWHWQQPADWPAGDVWKNPKRHRFIDPITGTTKPFGAFTGTDDIGWCHVSRVGLKAAGRLLDGKLWDQVPRGAEVPAG